MTLNEILNSNILKELEKFVPSTNPFTSQDTLIIEENIDQVLPTEAKKIRKMLKKMSKLPVSKDGFYELKEKNKDLEMSLKNFRNICQEHKLKELLDSFYGKINNYVKAFYRVFEYIEAEELAEIENAIFSLEHIKNYSLWEVKNSYRIEDSEYHSDWKDIIYTYSLFNKYATLILMFKYPKFDEEKHYYFYHLVDKMIVGDLTTPERFVEKTQEFGNYKLFQDFQETRENMADQHFGKMDEVLSKSYSLIGLFLLIFYTQEVIMQEYLN